MKSTDLPQLIESFTGISPERQAEICFEAAYTWLELVLEPDRYGMEMLPLQSGFWAWWQKNWAMIDQGFIESVSVEKSGLILVRYPGEEGWRAAKSEKHLAIVWHRFHDPRYVQSNQVLLRQSFHQYIKELVRSKS